MNDKTLEQKIKELELFQETVKEIIPSNLVNLIQKETERKLKTLYNNNLYYS